MNRTIKDAAVKHEPTRLTNSCGYISDCSSTPTTMPVG